MRQESPEVGKQVQSAVLQGFDAVSLHMPQNPGGAPSPISRISSE